MAGKGGMSRKTTTLNEVAKFLRTQAIRHWSIKQGLETTRGYFLLSGVYESGLFSTLEEAMRVGLALAGRGDGIFVDGAQIAWLACPPTTPKSDADAKINGEAKAETEAKEDAKPERVLKSISVVAEFWNSKKEWLGWLRATASASNHADLADALRDCNVRFRLDPPQTHEAVDLYFDYDCETKFVRLIPGWTILEPSPPRDVTQDSDSDADSQDADSEDEDEDEDKNNAKDKAEDKGEDDAGSAQAGSGSWVSGGHSELKADMDAAGGSEEQGASASAAGTKRTRADRKGEGEGDSD